jgi:TonB family protein
MAVLVGVSPASRWMRDTERTVAAAATCTSVALLVCAVMLLSRLDIVHVLPRPEPAVGPVETIALVQIELPPYQHQLRIPAELKPPTAGGPGTTLATTTGVPIAATDNTVPATDGTMLADGTGPGNGGDGVGQGTRDGVSSSVQQGTPSGTVSEEAFVEFADEDPAYDESDLMRRIRYPEMAKAASLEGEVTLRVRINGHGGVASVDVIHASHTLFIKPAMEAVEGTTFSPARSGGVNVASMIVIPVRFRLR